MAGSGSPQPKRPNPPRKEQSNLRKPLQVMHISRKEEVQSLGKQDSKDALENADPKKAKPSREEVNKTLAPPSKPLEKMNDSTFLFSNCVASGLDSDCRT